jgi:hypothetical protein
MLPDAGQTGSAPRDHIAPSRSAMSWSVDRVEARRPAR